MSLSTRSAAGLFNRLAGLFFLGLLVLLITGCVSPGYTVESESVAARPYPSRPIYFYPAQGQSMARQKRDRYECYLWAVKQSGFDPGRARLASRQRIEVRSATPPGSDVAVGAVSGAAIGSILSAPDNAGQGMMFGAITGAILGAASESSKQEQARRLQRRYNAMEARNNVRVNRRARNYRRAMSACLEGRDYTVR